MTGTPDPTAAAPVTATAQQSASIPEVTVRAADFAFEAPSQLEAGLVSITLLNTGAEPHLFTAGRLPVGRSFADIQAAISQNIDPLTLLDSIGGAGAIMPGGSQQVTLDVPAGPLVLLCNIRSADGQPHYAKGQIQTLDVRPAAGPAAAPPDVTGTLSLRDFAFIVPGDDRGVRQVWKVSNDGQDPHEVIITRANAGRTAQDVVNYYTGGAVGAAPADFVGGLSRISPGKSAWMTLDLPPGTYVLACRIPNEATGRLHSQLGMVRQLHLR